MQLLIVNLLGSYQKTESANVELLELMSNNDIVLDECLKNNL